jgi:hypothetical protein
MGFHVLIDIVGSAILGGILLVTLMNMKSANVQNNYKYSDRQTLQYSLVSFTEMVDNDLKQIGYANDSSYSNPIITATPTQLVFSTSIKPDAVHNPDGNKDQISYVYTDLDTRTANPSDTMLTRTVTSSDVNFNQSEATITPILGLVSFRFTYKNSAGTIVNLTSGSSQLDRNSIYSIQLDITMQSTGVYYDPNKVASDQYNQESVRWRRVFYPFKKRNDR